MLTPHAIKAMGFQDEVAAGSIEASFTSITVFEACGIVVAEGVTETTSGQAAGVDYRVAVSASVNSACQALVADDFEESEDAWRAGVKSNGPFALIAVGPTSPVACTAGRSKREPDGTLVTYDCFAKARAELQALEKRLMPPVVSALTCAFNTPDRYVFLKKLTRTSFGRTSDLTVIQDVYVEIRAEGYASRAIDRDSLAGALQAVSQRASYLNKEAAAFFALGLREVDQLKKFLYFFLSLEVQTQAVFGKIDHHNQVGSTVTHEVSPRRTLEALLERQVSGLVNLLDRFIWCTACKWTHLTDEDVEMFKKLKDARDAIAHARASEAPSGFARSAELLARKILWH